MVGSRLNQVANLLELGRWDEVAEIASDYLDVEAPEFGVGWEFGFMVAYTVWLYLRRGDLAEAHRIVDDYLVLPDGARLDMKTMVMNARLAVMNADGNHAEALEVAEATLRGSFGGLVVDTRASLIEAVDAAFALGRDDKVVELIALVRGRVQGSWSPSLEAHMLRWEARVAAGRGDLAEADTKFAAAIARFAEARRPFWAAVTRLEYASTLVAQDRDAEAEGLLTQARATFSELRAVPWVGRADALSAETSALRANVISA
jgi:hypothetical protein